MLTAPEILESRIAPAAFYVSGASLDIANASGAAQPTDTQAATDAHATKAFLLSAGDTLYFNPDGNVATHTNDFKWVSVVAGRTLVFFTDLNGDTKFSLNELTGLAVSDRFSGSVVGDVRGTIATMLDGAGKFTPTALQPAAIAKLSVSGALTSSLNGTANLLAGLGLSNVTVGQPYFSTADGLSVHGSVATGSSALGYQVSFNGGGNSSTPATLAAPAGASGGDIVNAHFSGGIFELYTGNGVDSATGAGGAGGTINNVTTGVNPVGFAVAAGDGGDATRRGPGGAGGKIVGLNTSFHSTSATSFILFTGIGGVGSDATGGAGGTISNSSIRALDPLKEFGIFPGDGGAGTGTGGGGTGGGVVNSSFLLSGNLGQVSSDGMGHNVLAGGTLNILLGKGGAAGNTGLGGAGGTWDWFYTTKNPRLLEGISGGTNAAVVAQNLASFALNAGEGGASVHGTGGVGGHVLGGQFKLAGQLGIVADDPDTNFSTKSLGTFSIRSGNGGDGQVKAAAAGRVEAVAATFYQKIVYDDGLVSVVGGNGGKLTGATGGSGGAGHGGDVKQTVLDFRHDVRATDLLLQGGDGGRGGRGDGGGLSGVAILANNAISGAVILNGGGGGLAGTTTAGLTAGGAGGSVANFLVQAPSISSDLLINGGTGGAGTGTGAGGLGGDINAGAARAALTPPPLTDAALATQLRTPAGVYITGSVNKVGFGLGSGGEGGGSGSGGNGGNFLNSKVFVGSVADNFSVLGGGGGAAHQQGTGGFTGRVSAVSLNVNGNVGGDFLVEPGNGGSAEPSGRSGAGKNIDGLSILVGGDITKHLAIVAPSGGSGGLVAGGAGGSIPNLHVDVGDILGTSILADGAVGPQAVSGASFYLSAGNGTGGSTGGAAGSISHATVTTGALVGGAFIRAGTGGGSTAGPALAGGSLTGSTFVFRRPMDGDLTFFGGDGGIGGSAIGGAGGAITSTAVTVAGAGNVYVQAGNAGNSHGGMGPAGGALDAVTVENTGPVNFVSLHGGAGSSNVPGVSKGGAGGKLSRSTVISAGDIAILEVVAGRGGDHLGNAVSNGGDAGAGGALTGFTLENTARLILATFSGGDGGAIQTSGANPDAAGRAGAGGAVTGLAIRDALDSSELLISGGLGGAGRGAKSRSGDGGAVTGTVLDTSSVVRLTGGDAGDVTLSGARSTGGAGGAVSAVSGRVGELSVIGGQGGDTPLGKGGVGGAVDTVNLSQVEHLVRLLAAGDGGNGATSGSGGSVSKVTVPGDIGDFHAAFGFGDLGMGGLIAGRAGVGAGGLNGSIMTVSAGRIAAILAGRPAANAIDPTSAANAVTSIKAVTADIIGADTGLTGTGNETSPRGFNSFTFVDHDGSPAAFSSGDTAIDGLVIVRTAGLISLSAVPLKLISVL